MTTPGYPIPPLMMENEKEHRRQLAQALGNAMGGKVNAITQVTLTPNSTTTTLIDSRLGANTGIFFSPLTVDAVTAQTSGLRVTAKNKGQATLTHASSASVDQTFDVLLIG